MRLGTKRYFCGGCGAVVEGPGAYCKDACVAKARAKAVGPPLTAAGSYGLDQQCRCLPLYEEPWTNKIAALGPAPRKKPDYGAALREGLAAADRLAAAQRVQLELEQRLLFLRSVGREPEATSFSHEIAETRDHPFVAPSVELARAAMVERQRNAWKKPAAKRGFYGP